jgi:hypothetical protein
MVLQYYFFLWSKEWDTCLKIKMQLFIESALQNVGPCGAVIPMSVAFPSIDFLALFSTESPIVSAK